MSLSVFVLVGFISADGGPTPSSVFQAFVLMVVSAAPAVSTLRAPKQALAMGGAMFVAGVALLPGGNPIGLLMLVPGALVMLTGIRSRPAVEAPEWIRLVGTAFALVVAVYLALDGGIMVSLIAVVLAVVVTMVNSRD